MSTSDTDPPPRPNAAAVEAAFDRAARTAVTTSPGAPVIAVVTEDAQPVYVNESRDTVEAPPLRAHLEAALLDAARAPRGNAHPNTVRKSAPAIVPAGDCAPAIVPARDSSPAIVPARESSPALRRFDTPVGADRVAANRGVAPIRMPSLSTAFLPLRAMATPRRVLIAATALAIISMCVAAAAVLWATTVVDEARDQGRLVPFYVPVSPVP